LEPSLIFNNDYEYNDSEEVYNVNVNNISIDIQNNSHLKNDSINTHLIKNDDKLNCKIPIENWQNKSNQNINLFLNKSNIKPKIVKNSNKVINYYRPQSNHKINVYRNQDYITKIKNKLNRQNTFDQQNLKKIKYHNNKHIITHITNQKSIINFEKYLSYNNSKKANKNSLEKSKILQNKNSDSFLNNSLKYSLIHQQCSNLSRDVENNETIIMKSNPNKNISISHNSGFFDNSNISRIKNLFYPKGIKRNYSQDFIFSKKKYNNQNLSNSTKKNLFKLRTLNKKDSVEDMNNLEKH